MNGRPRDPLEVTRRFTLLELLGEGAMGQVYAASDPETGRVYAVKLVHEALKGNEEVLDRFRIEAEVTSAIDHPGGVPVYGTGTTGDGRPFYVMKRVGGRTLRELLDERGPRVTDLHWRRRLLRIFEDLCATAGHAHRRGIVHRDLKPDNVLVGDDDSVTVVDWGLAKGVDRGRPEPSRPGLTTLGEILGSPGYMAPEQASGAAVEAGPPADVFALGAILHEILAGENPFPGRTPRESMLASIHRDPPDPRKGARRLMLPRSLVAICRKALEKEPQRRYANAGELARDLKARREGCATSATRPSLAERLRWAARRRPVTAAAGAAVAAVALCGAAILGAQIVIDHRLAEKAFAEIERSDARVLELDRLTRDVDRRWLTSSDPEERRRLELERTELETRRLLHQLDSVYLLREVARLRFTRKDPHVSDLIETRVLEAAESALDLDELAIARALAMAASPMDGVEPTSIERVNPKVRQRLEVLIREVDRRMEEDIRRAGAQDGEGQP